MSKVKDSAALPWIRTKQVIQLIADTCNGDPLQMEQSLLDAFVAGAIGCQAGRALFKTPTGTEVKYNWPVPSYIWDQPGSRLSLALDRFTAPIIGQCAAALGKTPKLAGTHSVTLLVLKIHEVDLRKHFQLPQRSKSRVTPPVSKAVTIGECIKWLRGEFVKDAGREKRKGHFASEARVKFDGALTVPGFLQAWKTVTAEVDHSARRAGGRPKGT